MSAHTSPIPATPAEPERSGGSLAIIGARLRSQHRRAEANAPDATALLITHGVITQLGNDQEIIQAARDTRVQVHDVRGATITPGLFDSHTHPHWAAGVTSGLDLGGLNTLDALRAAIAAEHARLPKNAWLRGWNLEYEAFEHSGLRGDLFADVAPGRPVALICYDLHTGLGTAAALDAAGITGARSFADASEIVVDEHGKPTGELREPTAYNLLFDAAPQPTPEDERNALRDMFRRLTTTGLTGGAIMDGKSRTVELLTELEALGELDHRVTVHHWHAVGDDDDTVQARIADRDRRGRLWQGGAIKLFSDGVIDTGTAWLHGNDTYGDGQHSFWPDWQRYLDVVRAYHEAGMLIATHAVGDQAVSRVLECYATLPPRDGQPAHSIEHLEVLSDSDIDALRHSGVTASMQPLHMQWREQDLSDNWAKRLGKDRAATGFRVRDVLKAGVRLTLGSDWPVAQYDPRIGMAWARGRRQPGAPNAPVFEPEQQLNGEEALLAYTLWPALARGHRDRGRIAPGFVADLTVWAQDPVHATPDELVELPVLLTLVDGRIVYTA